MSPIPDREYDRTAATRRAGGDRNPVVETLVAMVATSLLLWAGSIAGFAGLLVLAQPVLVPPWALLTSVYAHAGVTHLLSNAVVVAVAGSLVARATTRLRFHAFVVVTGALAGVAQVWVGDLLGPPPAVLGASGAAFALVGYVLAANPASVALFDRVGLPHRIAVVAVAVVAVGLTLAFSAPGSALVAHLTGATTGLVAGRFRLLRAPESRRGAGRR